MEKYSKLPLTVLASFPKVDEAAVHELFVKEWMSFNRKIMVLDDDPTGVQTVHDIFVYTDWTQESLDEGMEEEDSMFFVLTNSRSFSVEKTVKEHKLIAQRAAKAAAGCGKKLLLISRGDSTLRGHYPLELEVLKEALEQENGSPVHGQILCPFFREGGRFTIDSVHYVKEGDWLVPAGQTEFAADKTFGYHASHLGEYVEEKSGGRYRKENCIYVTLSMLREQKLEEITELLHQAEGFVPVIVDAIAQSDVETFAVCLLRAMKEGKEFLIRSAAAVPKVLGNVSDRPLLGREELLVRSKAERNALSTIEFESAKADMGYKTENTRNVQGGEYEEDAYGGIVLIGSHVKKTTMQLDSLRGSSVPAKYLEFRVNTCFQEGGLKEETERMIREAERVMAQGMTAVVYTSRELLAPEGMDREEMLKLSVDISNAVTDVIAGLHHKPRFLIAKGGITSSDVGTRALRVRKALVSGQVYPGIPVWRTGPESKFPGLSYIIFPGNVGDEDTLKQIVRMLTYTR